jgi:hypothetical protein
MYTLYRLLDDYFTIRLSDNKIILGYQISYNINRILTSIEYAIRKHLYKIPNQFQKYFIHVTLNCLNLKSNIRFDFAGKEVVITTRQKNVKVLGEFLTTYKYKFLNTYGFKSSMLTMIFPLFIRESN